MMAFAFFLINVIFVSKIYLVNSETVEFLSFKNCSNSGWSCIHQSNSFIDLLYQCNTARSLHIVVGETKLNLPEKVKSLTIQNCETVQLSFTFIFVTATNYSTTLALKNIVDVTLLPRFENVMLPKRLILEHIGLIKSLRSYTFTNTWKSLIFHNVTIQRVETDAFIHLNVEDNMKWDNVQINFLDSNGLNSISVTEFIINGCSIEIFESDSFQVQGHKVVIENSEIGDIRHSAITVFADSFHLVNNSGFKVVMRNALNILAREVIIDGNNFTYIQTEALERIGPNLIDEEDNSNIVYSFQNNHVEVADFGSLHVSLEEYLQIGATMHLGNNTFSCSCTHLGWLGLRAYYFKHLYEFHQRLLSPEENNTCSGTPCYLPISILQELVKVQNVCAINHTGVELCALFPAPTVISTTRSWSDTSLSGLVSCTGSLLACYRILIYNVFLIFGQHFFNSHL